MRVLPPLVTLILVCAGCSAEPVTVRTRAFQHPTNVDFVCFDVQPDTPGVSAVAVPLSSCAGDDDRFALHALVTQKGRGEVAAVDLDGDEILDSDARVPGFTFVPVGEIPVDIVVPAGDPTRTYVADLGSMDVRVVPTDVFRSMMSATAPVGLASIPLASPPTDLALSPDERRLFVALPDEGAIAEIDLTMVGDAMAPAPTLLALGTEVPAPVPAEPEETPYCKVCPSDRVSTDDGPVLVPCREMLSAYPVEGGARQPFAPREPAAAGMEPRPTHMVVVPGHDDVPSRLLVADRALPVVHVINLDDPAAAEPPIVVGVPTEQLAITPKVPATIDAREATEQFLYAIDATDGSVLVVRYDETDPSASAVLPVSVRGDADRLDLTSPARVIEVLTPGYAPDAVDAALCVPGSEEAADASPGRLRGVFLAAGLTDGSVAIVDVYDLDAPCRGGAVCESPPNDDDRQVFIQRHRPRIGSFVTLGMTLTTAPAVTANGDTFTVEPGGATGGEVAPDLAAVECGPFQTRVYPFPDGGGAEPLVCALADPWAARTETWTVTWEGALPGTNGGRGRLSVDGGQPTIRVEVPVCERGVLGSENVAALPEEAPEAAFAGDLLVVTGEVPPSVAEDAPCRQVVTDPDGQLIRLDFPIVHAAQVETADGAREGVLRLAGETRSGTRWQDVLDCFPELTTYEIHAQAAYTVAGSRTGYRHRVLADAMDGSCTVDTTLDPRRIGKAVSGTVYDNGFVRFQLVEQETARLTPADEAELSFQIGQVPGKLIVPIGDQLPTVISDLAFNPVEGNVYVVDSQASGLVELDLEPISIAGSFD